MNRFFRERNRPHRGHLFRSMLCAALLILISTAQTADAQSEEKGRVVLYLSGGSRIPPDLCFRLKEISLLHDRKGAIELVSFNHEISSLKLADCQIKIAEAYVPAGKYDGARWTLDAAHIVRSGRTTSLALPPGGKTATFPATFAVEKGQATSLFFSWASERSVSDTYLFQPVVSVATRQVELSRLLMFVTNTDSDYVTVIDREANRVVGAVQVGDEPRGLAVDERLGRVYVANAGSHDISVIDSANLAVARTVPLRNGRQPTEMVLSPSGQYLYVTNHRSNDVSIVDIGVGVERDRIRVGEGPVGIAYDAERAKIYVANSRSNTVSIIDARTHQVTGSLRAGAGPVALLLTGKELMLVNRDARSVSVVDLATGSIVRDIATGRRPARIHAAKGGRVYVTNQGSGDVSCLQASVDLELRRLKVGGRPLGLSVDRYRNRLFVADAAGDRIAVFDTTNHRKVSDIPVGKGPYGIAFLK